MSEEDSKSSSTEMKIDPARAKVLVENLTGIKSRVQAANKSGRDVRLIAVSKLKPLNDILALHRAPHTHLDFGENYLQELQQKAEMFSEMSEFKSSPPIRWHFIGALQTNKCKPLARDIPNLFCISSVDSLKKATELEKGRRERIESHPEESKLNIHVQVNTSGEESKSGVEPGASTIELCKHVRDECPNLNLLGLMTIGAIARSVQSAEAVNEDFEKLVEVRKEVVKELSLNGEDELELSMGMSADFEVAINQGSTEVRVGSEVFGERPQRKDAKVKEEVEEGKS